MNVLALETTERIGSVAAMADGNLLCELKLSPLQRSAQSLAPGIKQLLDKVGWRPGDVQLVATTIGPGSFTGLRVGVTTAKAFAYSVGADILGVDTLEAVAAGAPAQVQQLSCAVDAQRGDVVAQTFARRPDGWLAPAGPARLLSIGDWLSGLAQGTCLAGPILRKLARERSAQAESAESGPGVARSDWTCPGFPHLIVLDPQYWAATAASVARLATRDYLAGKRHDLWSLVPRYSRRSAAEEKWGKRRGD